MLAVDCVTCAPPVADPSRAPALLLPLLRPAADLRERLYHNTGFFLIAWAYHYFPFYLMSRQLFIHHYLPAHLASACLAGSILNFILTESVNYPASVAGPTTRLRPRIKAVVPRKAYVVFGALGVIVVGTFVFLAPFTYGTAL